MIFYLFLDRPPPHSTLFPYTTLFRSPQRAAEMLAKRLPTVKKSGEVEPKIGPGADEKKIAPGPILGSTSPDLDRKSTRLNSSHRCISYAVFCLKKKKLHETRSLPSGL